MFFLRLYCAVTCIIVYRTSRYRESVDYRLLVIKNLHKRETTCLIFLRNKERVILDELNERMPCLHTTASLMSGQTEN